MRHFTQDHCFYECSPNVGPWIVEVIINSSIFQFVKIIEYFKDYIISLSFRIQEPDRSWRNQRYFGVPLCASDCNQWFNDCKHDLTCVENWSRGFTWKNINESMHDLPSEGLSEFAYLFTSFTRQVIIFEHLGKTKKTYLYAHPQRVYASKYDLKNQKIQDYLVRKNLIEGCGREHFSHHQFFETSSKK